MTATSNGRHWFYDVAKNPVEMIGSSSAFTYTPTADGYIRISIYNYAEKLPTMQITQSSTAQSYEPYNKTTDLSLALGQTVYGGSLDLRTGKLAVTHIYRKFNGTENWTWYSASNSALLNDALTNRKGINSTTKIYGVCNVQATSSNGSINYIVATATSTANLQISQIGTNFGVSDVSLEGWKTWLATNNLEFTYELATPIEIQLTPHEISLLKDYAYVSTNGTSIALDYHNGELASLSDVAQLSQTVEELDRPQERTCQINITSYNTSTNRYSIPFDGYITAYLPQSTSIASVMVTIYDHNEKTLGIHRDFTNNDYGLKYFTIYVKRGMKAMITASSGYTGNVTYRGMA